MAEHAWVQENLDAYALGGLSVQERSRLERHLDGCSECTHANVEIAEADQLLEGVFARVRPDAGLEDRAIQRLRQSRKPRPTWFRFVAAAAVFVLGVFGAGVQVIMGDLALPGFVRDAELAQKGLSVDVVGGSTFAPMGKKIASTKQTYTTTEGLDNANVDITFLIDPENGKAEVMSEASKKLKMRIPEAGYTAPVQTMKVIQDRQKEIADNLEKALDGQRKPTDELIKEVEKLKDKEKGFFGDLDMAMDRKKGDKPGQTFFDPRDRRDMLQPLSRDENKESKLLTTITKVTEDALKKRDLSNLLGKDLGKGDDEGEKGTNKDKKAMDPSALAKVPDGKMPAGESDEQFKNQGYLANGGWSGLYGPMGPMPPGTGAGGFPGMMGGMGGMGFAGMPGMMGGGAGGPVAPTPTTPVAKTPPVTPTKAPASPSYLPMVPPPVEIAQADPKGGKKVAGGFGKGEEGGENKAGQDKGQKPGESKVNEGGQQGQPKPEPKEQPPEKTGRMIIRTGDMEFEIESFDSGVETINKLIYNVKGGFIATVNSDKLPNGKMKGSVVVRMPPQFLDKFIFDLRKELSKTGELKNQRLGSLDVTKQYTDIESRLRAARAIEERLIHIIKTGKGEIKDLVMAEKELGVWRTKIEEMEGEIRYYANQVSLSTLTISLTEKEIQTPTAIVVTETVTVRIEVEEVAKAHQSVMKAVEEMKGRITRSELKQHTAGQFLSVVHAEIPPPKKGDFIDQLHKLGIVSDFQENQRQHTEGGTGPAPALKPKQHDVVFQVTMNNTANIRPRQSADLKVASTDVPASYAKLLAAIKKAKGQVRDGKLNEQDKLNINATLDFNVPASEKGTIDKLIDDIGPILERVNIQAPVSELSTESKFGYTLLLRDFASIPARQSVIEILAVVDVPGAYQKLQDAIAKAKGQVGNAKLHEKDKLNIHAELNFTVPTEQKQAIEKLLEELGFFLSRDKVETPVNQLATTKKFGFSLHLTDFASVPASKALNLTAATNDVPSTYAKLLELIAQVKGKVNDSTLNEQDKFNISATLDFSVPAEDKKTVEKFLEDAGTVLSRTNLQMAPIQLSTAKKFGFHLFLRDFSTIPPSKASAIQLAATDVPGSFVRIQEAIVKAKGQIVDAKLNEQDKFNITAHLDFTVPTEERATLEKLLDEIGTMLTRNNVQVPLNQLSTSRKFGFGLTLRDFTAIPPSKAADLKVASNDVPATYAKLLEAISKAKGQVVDAKLNENDKLNVSAQVDFTVPTEQKEAIEKLLGDKDFGTVLSRNNVQAPMNQLSLAKKFGFSVTLRDFANILPTHATDVKIAAQDVPTNYAKIVDAVVKAKGQMSEAKLNEQDRLNVSASLNFTVSLGEKANIDRLLADIGPLLSRNNVQAPLNTLTSDKKFGYAVVLRDFANIPPRETFHLQLAAVEVPTAFRELQDAVAAAKGLVTVAQLSEDTKVKIEARFDFDVPAQDRLAIEKLFSKVGAVIARTSSQANVNDLATDQKVGFKITLRSTAAIPPRETVNVKLEVKNVDEKMDEVKELVAAGKGRILDSTVDRQESGKVVGLLKIEVPFASQATTLKQVKAVGPVVSQNATRNPQVAENELTTAHIIVTLSGVQPIVPSDEGIGATVKLALYRSFWIFSTCLMLIIVGLSFIVPWALVIWVFYKIYVRFAGSRDAQMTAAATPPSPPPGAPA